MTRPGPKPTSTRLRVIRGEWDSRRMMPEPQADQGECPAPEDLAGPARRIWEALAPELERKGLLAPRYAVEFRALCSAAAEMVRCEQLLAKAGPIIVGSKNTPVVNPASREFRHYARLTQALGADFGLSPAAVTQLGRAAGEALQGAEAQGASRLLG